MVGVASRGLAQKVAHGAHLRIGKFVPWLAPIAASCTAFLNLGGVGVGVAVVGEPLGFRAALVDSPFVCSSHNDYLLSYSCGGASGLCIWGNYISPRFQIVGRFCGETRVTH